MEAVRIVIVLAILCVISSDAGYIKTDDTSVAHSDNIDGDHNEKTKDELPWQSESGDAPDGDREEFDDNTGENNDDENDDNNNDYFNNGDYNDENYNNDELNDDNYNDDIYNKDEYNDDNQFDTSTSNNDEQDDQTTHNKEKPEHDNTHTASVNQNVEGHVEHGAIQQRDEPRDDHRLKDTFIRYHIDNENQGYEIQDDNLNDENLNNDEQNDERYDFNSHYPGDNHNDYKHEDYTKHEDYKQHEDYILFDDHEPSPMDNQNEPFFDETPRQKETVAPAVKGKKSGGRRHNSHRNTELLNEMFEQMNTVQANMLHQVAAIERLTERVTTLQASLTQQFQQNIKLQTSNENLQQTVEDLKDELSVNLKDYITMNLHTEFERLKLDLKNDLNDKDVAQTTTEPLDEDNQRENATKDCNTTAIQLIYTKDIEHIQTKASAMFDLLNATQRDQQLMFLEQTRIKKHSKKRMKENIKIREILDKVMITQENIVEQVKELQKSKAESTETLLYRDEPRSDFPMRLTKKWPMSEVKSRKRKTTRRNVECPRKAEAMGDIMSSVSSLQNSLDHLAKKFDNRMPTDCQDVMNFAYYQGSAVYTIKPDKVDKAFQVFCKMDSKEGWTIIQRRMDHKLSFDKKWMEYKNGFGDINANYWLGNDKIYYLTNQANYRLRIEMEDWSGVKYTAEYEQFLIDSSYNGYRLHVSGYFGNAGDSFSYHSNSAFTTKDNDNDIDRRANCAQRYRGGWWFRDCMKSNLNGLYYNKQGGKSKMYNGVVWSTLRGDQYSLKSVQMMIRPHDEFDQ